MAHTTGLNWIKAPPKVMGPTSLMIGNFDGIHLGHQTLIQKVKEVSQTSGTQSAVLLFHPPS